MGTQAMTEPDLQYDLRASSRVNALCSTLYSTLFSVLLPVLLAAAPATARTYIIDPSDPACDDEAPEGPGCSFAWLDLRELPAGSEVEVAAGTYRHVVSANPRETLPGEIPPVLF